MGAFAVSISRMYSCSCAMRAVMSWPMPTTRDHFPVLIATGREENLDPGAGLGDERELEIGRLLALQRVVKHLCSKLAVAASHDRALPKPSCAPSDLLDR